jgi:hypothetical protein
LKPDNAYVSGLKEDLGFDSNQLVNINAMYTAGAVIGQLPFTFLFPMFPMNYTIPGLEIGWGIFTLLQYRTEAYGELMAYRFFVGIFEVFDDSQPFRFPNSEYCEGSIFPWSTLCSGCMVVSQVLDFILLHFKPWR